MRGKYGGYQSSRSNGLGFARRKESRQRLLGPSPPESPDRIQGQFLPLDLGSIDFEETSFSRNEVEDKSDVPFDEANLGAPKSVVSGISATSSSSPTKNGSSIISGSSSFGERKSMLRARVVTKMKAQRQERQQALESSCSKSSTRTDVKDVEVTSESQHSPKGNDSKSYDSLRGRSEIDGNHLPQSQDRTSNQTHMQTNVLSTGFTAVPSDNGIETPVLTSIGGLDVQSRNHGQRQTFNSIQTTKRTNQHPLHVSKAATMGVDIDGDIHLTDSYSSKTESPDPTNKVSALPNDNIDQPKSNFEENQTTNRGILKGKVSRIAKMFTSRAVVPPQHNTSTIASKSKQPLSPKRNTNLNNDRKWPPSPAISSTSSASYKAWPGTQDGQGRTISLPKDDDETAVSEDILSLQESDEKVNRNASQDMEDWMNADDSSHEEEDEDENDINGLTEVKNPADRYLAAVVREASAKMSKQKNSDPISPPRLNTMNSSSMHISDQKAKSHVNNTPLIHKTDPPGHFFNSYFSPSEEKISVPSRELLDPEKTSPPSPKERTINIQNLFHPPASRTNMKRDDSGAKKNYASSKTDSWEVTSSVVENSSDPPTSPATSVSKDSFTYSMYTGSKEQQTISNTSLFLKDSSPSKVPPGIDVSGSEKRVISSGKRINAWKKPNHSMASNLSRTNAMQNEPPKQYPIIQPLSAAALAAQDKLKPPNRPINGIRIKGYRGFIDKRNEMPNLMDNESVTVASSTVAPSSYIVDGNHQLSSAPYMYNKGALNKSIDMESDVFDGISPDSPDKRMKNHLGGLTSSPLKANAIAGESDSDIFDGISNVGSQTIYPQLSAPTTSSRTGKENKNGSIVPIGKGLSSFQATKDDVRKRMTAKEFDADLTETETEADELVEETNKVYFSSTKPNVVSPDNRNINESMQNPGSHYLHSGYRSSSDSSSLQSKEDGIYHGSRTNGMGALKDLSVYLINPKAVRKLVRKFRNMCQDDVNRNSDSTNTIEGRRKAFALFEMRSRVMESDIERGLGRRGGTIPVDDMVLNGPNLVSMCIRDMVIVCKAWRDGASPKDVITAGSLIRNRNHVYCVKRKSRRPNHFCSSDTSISFGSDFSSFSKSTVYFEEVRWTDDVDFLRMRCPSMGPSHLRGSEIFTIGDCQSILLKLTNERCMQLRQELDEATVRQIDAEVDMNEEASSKDAFNEPKAIMTNSEIAYLSAMGEVKTISKQLVKAEKAYELVRNRIEMLVEKYKTLLLAIENESKESDGSVVSSESAYSVDEYDSEVTDNEKIFLARKAQKAELKAELSAREAMYAKEQAERISLQKQKELEALEKRLQELETKSVLDREEFERRLDFERQSSIHGSQISSRGSHALLKHAAPSILSEESKNNSKQRVKAKFRDRYAERVKNTPNFGRKFASTAQNFTDKAYPPQFSLSNQQGARSIELNEGMFRGDEEEMFQHVEFYERSLEAAR